NRAVLSAYHMLYVKVPCLIHAYAALLVEGRLPQMHATAQEIFDVEISWHVLAHS
ncbi:hypothetical protein ACJX0J_034890, partial [Zea mays]